MHYKGRILVLSGLLVLQQSFLVGASFAQTLKATATPSAVPQELPKTGINVSISPTFLNLITDPGKAVTSQFTIRNNNNFSENFTIDLAKFELQQGGKPVLKPLTKQDGFGEWMTFTEPQFSVAPNQTKTVKFAITPPQGSSLGYYYALIINRTHEGEGVTQGTKISGVPAILTLLEVRSTNAKRELQLVDFKTDQFIVEYLPVTFTLNVKNTGNVHIIPHGNIFIDQGGKKDIAILSPNESRGNVLPQSEREFSASWQDGFAVNIPATEDGHIKKDVEGKTVYTTAYDFQKADKFRIGKYTANLLLVYDNGERDVPIEASVTFWVLPWKMIGAAIVVLILALFGLKSIIWNPIRKILSHGKNH